MGLILIETAVKCEIWLLYFTLNKVQSRILSVSLSPYSKNTYSIYFLLTFPTMVKLSTMVKLFTTW